MMIPLGIQKKEEKINALFHMSQLRFILTTLTFTNGNVCPTLRVWGVPTWFEQAIRTCGGGAGWWGQSVHR